jgi:nucleotide-binding universal stress UspA family protein
MKTLKVLIPTDFTVQAEYAYLLIQRLSEKIAFEVHFIHVLNVPDTVTMDNLGNIQTCGEIDAGYVTAQKKIAERQLEALRNAYTNVHTKLLLGKTTDTVTEYASREKFDLITMGTKGSWGLKEKLSGSETQMIARKSHVPVLSMMCDRSDLEIQNILLVHDFRDSQTQELSLMKNLVSAFGATIHMLQITASSDPATDADIRSAMDAFANRHELSNYECHIVHDQDIENGVIHFNQMNNMDIICMGTHGKGGLFHSSATEKLIKHMFKPIISFHLN